MTKNSGLAAAVAVTAVAVLVTACSGGSDTPEEGTGSETSTQAASIAPIPASPVTTEKKLGDTSATVESEDAFLASLKSDPCSSTLTDGIEAILQNYQRVERAFGATVNATDINISGTAGTSPGGMPQCTYTVTGAGTLSSIRFAGVTAADNIPEPGRLQWDDVIAKSASEKPTGVADPIPRCRSTDEFLRTVQEMGPNPALLTSEVGEEPRIVDRRAATELGQIGVNAALTTSSAVEAQLRCDRHKGMVLSRPDGQSPDWLVQTVMSTPAGVDSQTWKAMRRTAKLIAQWVAGGTVTDQELAAVNSK